MRVAVLVVAMVPVAACARGPEVASPASHPTAHPLPSPLPTPTATAVRTATRTSPAFRPGDPTATPPGSEITDPNYLAGVEAYWSDDFSAVIPLMQAVLEADPSLAPPHWYLGMASWSLGDCDTGLAEMEQALAIDPGYALAWADRGLMHLCLGNERQAVLDFETALSLDPSLAKVHNRLATLHYNHGEYDRALEEYDLTLAIDPLRAAAWNGRGETLMQLGRYDECIESSTRAIDLDPELWEAYAGRGLCALAQEEYVGAVADYEVYVAAVPDDPTVWYNLGIAYRHAGNPQAAVAAYGHTLDLEPDYYQALINRGWARIDLEEYDEAVADFTAALEFGEIAAAYNGLGDVYLDQGLFEEAARNYERAMQLAPYDAYAYCRAPGAYFELGRYAEAIESAQMAASIEPNCASDWYLLEVQGRSCYALGRYDEAIDYLTQALGRQDYMMGHYYRGIAYQAAGLKWQAAGDLRVFLAAARAYGYAGEEVADAELRMQLLGEE
jgi:tetratricopeptide (TPR) repeat protein